MSEDLLTRFYGKMEIILEKKEAQLAVYRDALEELERLNMGSRFSAEFRHVLRKALDSSSAGTELLERVRKLEVIARLVEEFIESGMSWDSDEDFVKALKDLEKK